MKRFTLLAAVGLAMLYAQAAYATLINVDFSTARGTYEGAAVIGADGDFWNTTGATATSGTISLKDTNENDVTGVSMSWDAPTMISMGSRFWNALMNDQIAIASGDYTSEITVTLSGLVGTYDLHVYGGTCQGDNNGEPVDYPKKIELTVASGVTTVGTKVLDSTSREYLETNPYIVGQNYDVFEDITIAEGDTLTITGLNVATSGTAAFNGFQLQEVPEPATMMLLLTGIVGLLVCARRKRK